MKKLILSLAAVTVLFGLLCSGCFLSEEAKITVSAVETAEICVDIKLEEKANFAIEYYDLEYEFVENNCGAKFKYIQKNNRQTAYIYAESSGTARIKAVCRSSDGDIYCESNILTVTFYTNEISTVEQLRAIAGSNKSYLLTVDIDLSDEKNWQPIDGFSGLLSGGGHTVKGLNISGNKGNAGLFSTLKGTVKNLTVDINASATGVAEAIGAVCGTNDGNIENVTVNGVMDVPYFNNVGGICGVSNGDVNNCVNNARITGYECVGGVVGYYSMAKDGNVSGNTNNAEINGLNSVGGIVGKLKCVSPGWAENYNTAKMSDCKNVGRVSASGDNAGGIVGCQTSAPYSAGVSHVYDRYYSYLCIVNCSNFLEITGKDCVGGILGYGEHCYEISGAVNTADITGKNYVGGYVGKGVNTSVKVAENSNKIEGDAYVGGIAGYCGNLANCNNAGEIIAKNGILINSELCIYLGGVAGYAEELKNCKNESDILLSELYCASYTGGLAGRATLINDCANTASKVVSGGDNIGGLVGYLEIKGDAKCDGNINEAAVNGGSYVGGIAGRLQCSSPGWTDNGTSDFTNGENKAAINGTGNYVGGIIGFQSSTPYSIAPGAAYTRYYIYANISGCVNSGTVNGGNDKYIGGILGYGEYCNKSETLWNTNRDLGSGHNIYGGLK